MKNMLRISHILVLSVVCTFGMFAQSLLREDFSYPAGDSLALHTWTVNYPCSGPVMNVYNGGLTYPGYPGSGVGNSITLVGNGISATGSNGEDVYKTFSSEQSSGTIYVSFLLNVTQAPASQDYFFCLTPAAPSGKYQGRVNIKVSGGGFQLGIEKTTETIIWAPTVYSLNTTHVVLLKYFIVGDVAGTDDYCQLFVNPNLNGADPSTPDAQCSTGTADAKIGAVFVRQGGTTYNFIQIDEIRASTSWTDLALPVELTSFTAHASAKGALLSWQTATEVNNRGFAIERRAVVSGGSSDWQQVGFVQGAGTSNASHSYSYSDQVSMPGRYSYRLKQMDNDGAFKYYNEIEVAVGAVREFKLYGNYPNPFNPSTAIRFTVSQDGPAEMKVFNAIGQEVATVFNGYATAGQMQEASFNASQMPSGMYFARLKSGSSVSVIKMMLMK